MEQTLPCQSYIIRNLQDSDQEKITEAGKNFFLKYLEAGLSMEDAYSFLLSLEQMSSTGTRRMEFFIKDGENISLDAYRENILSDNKIRRIPCETLYKRVDRNLSACLFCPAKCPSYETQLALEKKTAAFVFASEENFMAFSHVLKELKLSIKDCFYSYMDLSESLFLSKPYAAATLLLLMETLYENAPSFFHGICAGEMESIRREFFLKLETAKRFPKELKEKPDVRSILYARACSLLYATPIQKEELKDTLITMNKNRQKLEQNTSQTVLPPAKEEKKPETGTGEILEQFLKETPETKELPVSEEPALKKQTASPLQTDILPDEITLEELTDDNFDLIHPDISGQKEETEEENSGKQKPDCEDGNNKNLPLKQTQKAAENLSQVSAQERQTEAKKDTPSAFTKTENNTGRKQEETTAQTEMTVPKKTATQKKKPKKVHSASSPTLFDLMKETEKNVKPHNNNLPEEETHVRLDMQGMYVPTFTSQIKENHAKPLSQKDAYYFLNLAGKTGCLFLEVFLEPGGIPVLVLYDTFRDTFFYVKNPNDYDGILLRILCHKSIRKICVNPYTLYGYTYTFSHFAKNVFSLERQKLSDTLFHTRRIKTLPASLSLMKQYPSILKQAEEIWDNKTDSLFQKKLLLDAAYGCSLMTNRFFKERLLLFNMEENEQLHFYLPKKLTPDNKGTFLGYHLTHGEDSETDLLFDDLLTFICDNGCFKNIPFQILYKDNHSVLFFIEEDFKKRFDAICTIRLTELCETYSLSQALLQVDMHQSYEEAVKQVTS